MVQWWVIVLTILCIFLSGTFSGLTLGLMSLDLIDLRVISESGTEREKWYAHRILPVRSRGNWLLCTLLIGNTAVNAALAIFTADLFGGIFGFLSSTFIILYIGEIIPQAVCYRYGLIVGAYAVPFVRVLMYITAPLSFTTAKALDFFLGGESATRYNRSQLKSLLSMHGVERSDPDPSLLSRSTSLILSPTPDRDPGLSSSPTNDTIIELRDDASNHSSPQSVAQSTPDAQTTSNPPSPPPIPPPPSIAEIRLTKLKKMLKQTLPLRDEIVSIRFSISLVFTESEKQRTITNQKKDKDDNSNASHPPLTKDEMAMLGGAFDFGSKIVSQVMTPLDDVFMLDASVSLNFKILLLIFQSGHSRVPIYSESRDNIIGLLFAKDLILLDPEDSVPIKTVLSFFNRTVFSVMDDTRLNKMLNIFCQGGGHMAIVRKSQGQNTPQETIGIVTLEDLIEELIGQDIVDETDVYRNNLSKQRVKRVRSIDPDVLKMFDSTHDEEILSEKEVLAVASYLSNNIPEFSEQVIKLSVLRDMLAEIPIIECHGGEQHNEFHTTQITRLLFPGREGMNDIFWNPQQEPINAPPPPNGAVSTTSEIEINDDTTIYSKGVPSKNAYLIIHGKLQIIAGDDGFISEAGPWTLLGVRALAQDLYAPDFTARVVERPTRVLRISRKLYRLMIHASGLNNRDKTAETSRVLSEARMAEQPSLTSSRTQRESSSASRPSLAVAAAAAAMAIGSPSPNESLSEGISPQSKGSGL